MAELEIWDFRKCPGPIFPILAKRKWFWKCPHLSGSKFQLLAIHKLISHIWEDGSRKVNNDEPDLRFFHGNFWPVISQAVQKPCFSAWIPRGPNFWKPLTCGYVAAGAFFFHKKGTIFLEALNLWVRCRRRLFFSTKKGPIFLGTDHEGTARKYLARHGIMRARHGNI